MVPGSEPLSQSARRVSVLLVDDLSTNLLALEAILQDLNLNLVQAHSGEEAFRRLLKDEFAVILLDVQMQGLDGFETAQMIRRRQQSQHTPIIFLTAYDTDGATIERAYALGAVDFLVKPILPVVLRAKVTGFVELFEKTRQVKRQAEQLRQLERQEFTQRLDEENARLRESERRFRALARHAPVGIFETDARGHCLFVNERWCDLAGLTADEAQGTGWVSALHPEDRQRIADEWYSSANAAREFTSEYRFQTPQGKISWLQGTAVPLRNDAGDIAGYIGTVTDITELKRAETERREIGERFRFLAESMPQKIFTAKPNGDVDYFNQQWTEFTGLSFEQIKDWGWTQFVHPDDVVENIRRWRHSIDTSQPLQFEHRFRRFDGAYRWHLSRALPLRDAEGTLVMWIGSNTDIDDVKRAEEELKEADRRKNEFLAMLAHELRNPLAPVRNAVQIMKMPGANDQAIQKAREMIERQVNHLVRLVDDLLDVSRIMRNRIELRVERLSLATVFARAVETAQPAIDANGHELSVHLPGQPIMLEADPVRLAQVVSNLLINAAKYTEKANRMELTGEREEGTAVIRVTDNGIGIDPALLPHIFDLFTQADRSLARSQGGLGIGLTVVKHIVEMHGGSVSAQSPGLNQGSEFIVRLPVLSQEPVLNVDGHDVQRLPDEQAFRDADPHRRVLIVDDNVDAADSAAMLLRLSGYVVETIHDGNSVLDKVAAFRPEVVLLDIGLPGMSGYDVARALRAQPETRKMVLVAVTGYGQSEDRQRSQEAGFNHHLVKPIDPVALQAVLASMSKVEG